MQQPHRLIATSRIVVRIGIMLNRLFLAAVCLALLLSWPLAEAVVHYLSQATPGVDAGAALVGLRYELLIGIVMALATDRLLTALAQMVESARLGDPFIAANARRLQTIGWALLVLQLLDLCGIALGKAVPSLGSAAPDADFSAGGWVAVLMVFILAQVFATGATMREELAATI